MKPNQTKPRDFKPWYPAQYSDKDVAALQAVASGNATPEQQKAALLYIVNTICGDNDLPFFPGDHQACDFAAGKLFVGKQIKKLCTLDLYALRQAEAKKQ